MGVAVYEVLPLRGRSQILSLLMGGGRQRAIGHLGVMALIGEVTEPLLLKPNMTYLFHYVHSGRYNAVLKHTVENRSSYNSRWFMSETIQVTTTKLNLQMITDYWQTWHSRIYVPVDQGTLPLHQVWMCKLHSSSLQSLSSSPSAHLGAVWLCAEGPETKKTD